MGPIMLAAVWRGCMVWDGQGPLIEGHTARQCVATCRTIDVRQDSIKDALRFMRHRCRVREDGRGEAHMARAGSLQVVGCASIPSIKTRTMAEHEFQDITLV